MQLSFLNQAQHGKNGILPYILTFITVVMGNILGSIPLIFIIIVAVVKDAVDIKSMLQSMQSINMQGIIANPAEYGVDTNLIFLGMLLTFVFTLGGLWLGVAMFHKRAFATLINGFGAVRWSRFFVAFGVWFGITAMMEGVNYMMHPADYTLCFQGEPFLGTLLISLFILPFQTSCEEFVFRGWLMQGIGSIAQKPWVPLLITSVLFGAMHFANPEVTKYGIVPMAVYYIGFGLFMGLVALLDDGLELSLGLHFGNNFFGATMVSFTSSALQTNTVFRTTDPDVYALLPLSIIGAVTAFFIFKKLYNFAPISVLFEDKIFEDKTTINP
jgi:uncharacterized protein